MAKIYLASSWRNQYQPQLVNILREHGHEVYDFRNPFHGQGGFKWKNVDERWENWSNEEYIKALSHPVSQFGFRSDLDAMEWADVCVLLLPCGRSAHTEAGWFSGKGKKVIAYLPEKQEPELMYKLFSNVVCTTEDILIELNKYEA